MKCEERGKIERWMRGFLLHFLLPAPIEVPSLLTIGSRALLAAETVLVALKAIRGRKRLRRLDEEMANISAAGKTPEWLGFERKAAVAVKSEQRRYTLWYSIDRP